MIPFVTTDRLVAICLCGAAATSVAVQGVAADPRDTPRSKAEIDRKTADQKRKFEQTQRELKAKHQRALTDFAKARANPSSKPTAPPFNASSAPPPEECLNAFIAAAKTANSMESLLRFLPDREQEILRNRQSQFDPKQAAKNRESLQRQNSKLTEEQLAHLSSSPFATMLKWHKGMADSIVKIQGVKIDGDKATVGVVTSSGATINGERYGYGAADVEMVGEGSFWKLARFKSSIVVYKDVP
jgi:hypothetical protein